MLMEFERKAAAFLTSGNKAIAESSRLGANRLFNSGFRFQSYPMMKANQFRKVSSALAEAWESGDAAQKRAATEQFARFMGYSTMQGALTVAISTLMTAGAFGLKVAANEAKDSPLWFMLDSFAATIGGPMYAMWQGMRRSGVAGVGEAATSLVFPLSMTHDLVDAAQGAGRYRDLNTFDRIGKFLKSKTPGMKPIELGLALAGLSSDDKELDTAISAYYRWSTEKFGRPPQQQPSRDEFRSAMKRAVAALKSGDREGYMEAYLEAAGAAADKMKEPSEAIASSLRSRKILKNNEGSPLTAEEVDELRNRIGDDAYDKLVYYDLMLDKAADGGW